MLSKGKEASSVHHVASQDFPFQEKDNKGVGEENVHLVQQTETQQDICSSARTRVYPWTQASMFAPSRAKFSKHVTVQVSYSTLVQEVTTGSLIR